MAKSHIDTQEIVRLYVDEKRTVREIATRLCLSYGRVYDILRSRVVMRSRSAARRREYVRVAEIMRERIVTGDWGPNRKILSQHDLATVFDVRQQTIREAIDYLRRRGYLMTLPSKGTYVRPRKDWK